MRCQTCGASVAEFWAWCPDCGGRELAPETSTIDLRYSRNDYVVDWGVPTESADESVLAES